MKKIKKWRIKLPAVALAFALLFNASVCAATFSDVPSSHWAYTPISQMADLGFMVGDSSGKYNPNQVIDKFYASKAMAKADGYKTVGYTADEKAFQDNAYEANKATLNMFKNTFKKWDSTADREIAFLLEKNVLTAEDLNKFVTAQPDGSEAVRALLKEDAAVFLVKLMEKQNEALSANQSSWVRFSDDTQIANSAKPYVYQMKSMGLVSGDTSNKFNPTQSVTKAVFAVMLNGAYTAMGGAAPAASASGATNTIESVSGTIVEVYAARNALQIETLQGKKSIHNVALGTSVTIDGVAKPVSDLQAGMSFSAVLVNDEITNLKASITPAATSSLTTQTTPQTATQTAVPANLSTIEGTVSAVVSNSTTRSISVDVRMLSTVGAIYNETRTFSLSPDCAVTRGGKNVVFSEIAVGDIVTLKVSGTMAYSIAAQQANMEFTGVLLEKRRNEATNTNYYVIEDSSDNTFELIVDDKTVIERAPSEYGLKWNNLKQGDKVSVKTSYNVITYIKGEGSRNNAEGIVKEMHIYEDDRATILFKNSETNETREYMLHPSVVDIYSMRIGDKLRLRLDSWEIDSYTKLESSSTQNVSGKVTTIRSTSFVVTPINQTVGVNISFDANTYVYDAVGRKETTPASLMQNMEVFVTYQQGSTNYASSITILNK